MTAWLVEHHGAGSRSLAWSASGTCEFWSELAVLRPLAAHSPRLQPGQWMYDPQANAFTIVTQELGLGSGARVVELSSRLFEHAVRARAAPGATSWAGGEVALQGVLTGVSVPREDRCKVSLGASRALCWGPWSCSGAPKESASRTSPEPYTDRKCRIPKHFGRPSPSSRVVSKCLTHM